MDGADKIAEQTRDPFAGKTLSKRRTRQRESEVLTPLQQVRFMGNYVGKPLHGSWAYFIRPDGATIRDALVICPNGGVGDIPNNPRLASALSANHEYYQKREENKGHIYVGQKLTEGAIRLLVRVLMENQAEEVAWLKEEIEFSEFTLKNSESPTVKEIQRRRLVDLKRRLGYVEASIEPEPLIAELNEIAWAQQLSSLPPEMLSVMRSMIGEVRDEVMAAVRGGRGRPTQRRVNAQNEFMDMGGSNTDDGTNV